MVFGRLRPMVSSCATAVAAFVCALIGAGVFTGSGVSFAQTSHPYCQSGESDSDGDGWGWENSKSCIVAGTVADKQKAPLSNCPKAQLDTDGDGFGWHSGASCRILPTCRTASTDSDGDGYGWQDGASCIVRGDVRVDIVPQVDPCGAAVSDPDGDGYGYENGAKCVMPPQLTSGAVVATPSAPVCISPDSDPDGDGFGDEYNQTCIVELPKTTSTISLSDVTEVIVITGQSNALGSQTAFDESLDAPHERVFAYTDDGWQIADLHQVWDDHGHPGNYSLHDSSRRPYNNLAFQFAKSVASQSSQRVPAFIIDADPGKGIANWDYNASFYRKLNSKIRKALDAMPHKSSVDAILWHQGENDWLYEGTSDAGATGFVSKNSDEYKNYYAIKLTDLIRNFRNEAWARSDTAFICGETRRATGVNRRLMALNTDTDPLTGCVPATDLPARSDDPQGSHFSAAGLRTLGRRYADRYLAMTGG